MARFSVATDHAFKNRSGEAVIETTWHQVTAFKSDRMPDFSALSSAGRFSKPSGRRVLRSRLLFCAAPDNLRGGSLPILEHYSYLCRDPSIKDIYDTQRKQRPGGPDHNFGRLNLRRHHSL